MRVAIVNDLRIATEALRRLLASQPDCTIAWIAADGAAAVEMCAKDRPDLVLMDLVMPVMDGVKATRRIMQESPCPILLVTASIEGNLARVYNALGAGALDAVTCPTFGADGSLEGGEPVLKKIRVLRRLRPAASPAMPTPTSPSSSSTAESSPPTPPPSSKSTATPARSPSPAPPAPPSGTVSSHGARFVLIGSSTGGPEALGVVLRGLSKSFTAPIVIVQHLDPEFVPGFVEWLSSETARTVRAIAPGDRPTQGLVLVACSNDHLVFARDGSLRYEVEPADEPYRPSVDAFFHSAAIPAVAPGVAVVLTGMGRDGAQGLLKLRQAGWRTLAQDQATSVVYGMPRAAKEAGGVQQVVALPDMGVHIETAWRAQAAANGRDGS